MQLLKNCKFIHHMNAVAAGTSAQLAAAGIDMQGWDGVVFIADIGTLTASQVTALEAKGCATGGGSYAAFTTDAVTAAMADADSNKLLVLDVYKPVTRYVKANVQRGTANAVINCVIAILYKGEKAPVTADASVSQSAAFVSP